MKSRLALGKYVISEEEQKAFHVLIWKKEAKDDLITFADEQIGVEEVNDFLVARNAEELIRAIEKFGCQSTLSISGKLESADCGLLERECRLYPYSSKRGGKKATARVVEHYSIKESYVVGEDGNYTYESLLFWVQLHDLLCILCTLIAQADDCQPLTHAGFERMTLDLDGRHNHGWGMRTVTDAIDMGDVGLKVVRDDDGESFWFCHGDSDDERLAADALIDNVTRALLPIRCKNGRLMRDNSDGNILQKMWSVIHSNIFTSAKKPAVYHIICCKRCGRVKMMSSQGGVSYFCSTSCRCTWNQKKKAGHVDSEAN